MKKIVFGAIAVGAVDHGCVRAGGQRAGEHPGASEGRAHQDREGMSKEFKFVLSAKSAKRGIVIFKVTNVGALQHDFQIKGRKTPLLSHGKSATLRISFLRKGSYPYKCTVAGHAAAGMKGVFTIT